MQKEITNELTTYIIHSIRLELDLSCNEYCFLDLVDWSQDPDNGWCTMSKEKLGEMLGLVKQTILRMVPQLMEKGFLEKHQQSGYIRVTEKWTKALEGAQQMDFDDPNIIPAAAPPVDAKPRQALKKFAPTRGAFNPDLTDNFAPVLES